MCAKAWADLMSEVSEFFGGPRVSSLFTMDGEAILNTEKAEGEEEYERHAVDFIKLMELGRAVRWLLACEDSVFFPCADSVVPTEVSENH
jgi:hypothetical protein